MKKVIALLLFISINTTFVYAQGTSGTNAKYEYRNLIDMPTAGILKKGNVGVSTDVMPFGVLVSKIEVGVYDNVSFGISYGGANIIGSGKIDLYDLPGVNIRVRIWNEDQILPAFTLGFDSQGKGLYNDEYERYQIKSPGFFIAASKNFEIIGFLSLHGVINYSLERDDADKDLNIGIGFEKTLGAQVSFIGEYDFAINDNTGNSLGSGNGFLNFGLRFSIGDGFTIGLNLRDLLDNKKVSDDIADRGIFAEYVQPIF
ncbi:MAG: YjbH domain-containing protein [Bacteroidota bacterium]